MVRRVCFPSLDTHEFYITVRHIIVRIEFLRRSYPRMHSRTGAASAKYVRRR